MVTHVIGTAGHVDHGKSSLVTALTGINPDRLKEEQAREMTIELGFAWFKLPSGEEVGVVDVPGHRDFIDNMLAGVGGIDAVLFVIAVDEGVMPQTREHLAILDILQIKNGIIVLTKCDMVGDEEWISLIEDDIRNTLKNTVLSDSPIIRVSSKTGFGIQALKEEISKVLEDCPPKADISQPRLPIDRVFSMPGFGTIVTGTLSDGSFKVGDEIIILPASRKSRIRGIQNHKNKLEQAHPGQRTAINITGIPVEEVNRGDVITLPGLYPPSRRIDVQFSLLNEVNGSLKHRSEVKLYHGCSEILGSIRLLGMDELLPGTTAFLQIELTDPVVAKKGDRFILRRPSPGETLGGGSIIEVASHKRYKRFSAEILTDLEKKLTGTSADKLFTLIHADSPILVSDLLNKSELDSEDTIKVIMFLEDSNQIKTLVVSDKYHQNLLVSCDYLHKTFGKVTQIISTYHQSNPLRTGMSREELRSKLKLNTKVFNLLIDDWINHGEVSGNNVDIRMPDHKIILTPSQVSLIDSIKKKFDQNSATPPSVKDCVQEIGDELYRMLLEQGEFIQVSEDVVYTSGQFLLLKAEIISHIEKHGKITVADFRDKFNSSRKYGLAFLEYLDRTGITRREGDFRKLSGR